jgi:hypothetical protein
LSGKMAREHPTILSPPLQLPTTDYGSTHIVETLYPLYYLEHLVQPAMMDHGLIERFFERFFGYFQICSI